MNPIEGLIVQPGQRAIALDDDDRSVRIRLASMKDVQSLSAGDPVAIVKASVAKTASAKKMLLIDIMQKPTLSHVYVRSESGEFHQVGFVTRLDVVNTAIPLDVTGFGDASNTFIAAPIAQATMTVQVVL